MRVLVVDDQWIVESAVARALAPADHDVIGVRSPEHLAALLATDRDFQLAFIDLDFQHESKRSGLAALEECGKAGVPAAIITTDGEHNRLLHLLAAFEFYPSTLTLVSKNDPEKEWRDVATAVAYGHHPNPKASTRFRPPQHKISWINSLVRRPRDLALWRAVASYDRHSTICQATGVVSRTLSDFLEDSAAAVHQLQHRFFDVEEEEPKAGTKKKNLQVVTGFAKTYGRFFSDQDVERLVTEMYGTEGRQEGQGRAAGVQRRTPRIGRRK
ncbi:response regulator [Streptomyces sp. MT29]|nr:response regulator [Streptomyces sp. MT29]